MARKSASKSGDLLRKIPGVDQLLDHRSAAPTLKEFGREPLLRTIRGVLDDLRVRLRKETGGDAKKLIATESILGEARTRLERLRAPHLCRVINATGVVLHTGLGRAVLPEAAMEAIRSEQRGYSLLELDRESGDRGVRETFVVDLLREVTGADAATIVNNNAGATLLILTALAKGGEVICSRGQLVEIGGSFRIPDVMEQSGARLVEVGATNKTKIADYEKAITENTTVLLRVHPSNYRIVGFTHQPSLEELVALGRKHNLPVMDDLGSGALVDFGQWGLTDEPTPQESLKDGADIICFSGDKLLGGPQAGIIVGRPDLVATIRRHPLFRALRPDKLTLTAMEATLKLFLDPVRLMKEHPTLRMISAGPDELEKRALDLANRIQKIPGLTVDVLNDTSEVGGGSIPGKTIPTRVVAVTHPSMGLKELARRLRMGSPSILPRVQRERLLFDVRTLLEGDGADIASALSNILNS